jgi:hypothetical protein
MPTYANWKTSSKLGDYPAVSLTIQIDNPALKGVIKPSDVFYVDFEKVPKA